MVKRYLLGRAVTSPVDDDEYDDESDDDDARYDHQSPEITITGVHGRAACPAVAYTLAVQLTGQTGSARVTVRRTRPQRTRPVICRHINLTVHN